MCVGGGGGGVPMPTPWNHAGPLTDPRSGVQLRGCK